MWYNIRVMTPLVEKHLDEIRAICRRHGVTELALFGSAVGETFDPERSDLDFLVHFAPTDDPFTFADAYFALTESLHALFHRDIDLVVARTIKNPYFREEIEETKVVVYAA